MSWPAAAPEIRWTVTVTGRSARGLLRDSTSYSTKHARDDAEQAGLALAVSKWPASTVPVKLSSYASVHVVRADQDWREICQWRERSLEGESQSEHESNERPRCARCGHLLNLRTGRCWACGRTQEEWESEKAAMEAHMNPEPSSETLDNPDREMEITDVPWGDTPTPVQPDGWCGYADREAHSGAPCPEPPHSGAPCGPDCEWWRPLPKATVSLSHDGEAFTDPISLEEFRRRAEAVEEHLGCQTGEIFRQQTLDPTIFPAAERRDVPMVNLSLTGKIPLTQSEWESYCDQGLEAGRMVKMTLTGYLPDPHAKWVKRTRTREDGEKETWWEQEGAVKVKVLELGSFELRGVYDGE